MSPLLKIFYIETSDDTIQPFIYVVGQIAKKLTVI